MHHALCAQCASVHSSCLMSNVVSLVRVGLAVSSCGALIACSSWQSATLVLIPTSSLKQTDVLTLKERIYYLLLLESWFVMQKEKINHDDNVDVSRILQLG